MRNESKEIKLKNGWLLRATLFEDRCIGFGLRHKNFQTDAFTSKIFLNHKELKALIKVFQKFDSKLERQRKRKVTKDNGKEEIK